MPYPVRLKQSEISFKLEQCNKYFLTPQLVIGMKNTHPRNFSHLCLGHFVSSMIEDKYLDPRFNGPVRVGPVLHPATDVNAFRDIPDVSPDQILS